MLDLKKKAISGIKDMLNDRMSERLKPKATVEVDTAEMKPGAAQEEEVVEGDTEPMGLAGKVEAEGGDLSKLNPDERAQLAQLYEKMGC